MESALRHALTSIAAHLDQHGRPWCLVGGLAASFWTEPRFTKDLDVVVLASDDDEATSILQALLAERWRLDIVLEHARTDRVATARLFSPEGQRVDVIFATCGIEPEIIEAATMESLMPGVDVPVVRPGHLVAMKLLSERDTRRQDGMDLVNLLSDIDDAELARAETAAALIMARGAARHKDLVADLQTWLARARG